MMILHPERVIFEVEARRVDLGIFLCGFQKRKYPLAERMKDPAAESECLILFASELAGYDLKGTFYILELDI